MSAKEKAKELMHYYLKELLSAKYSINGFVINDLAKQCALIAVDEVIKVCPFISKENCETIEQLRANDYEFISYWQEVKQEIEKL